MPSTTWSPRWGSRRNLQVRGVTDPRRARRDRRRVPDPSPDPVGLWNASRDSLLEALDDPEAIGRAGNYWFGESSIDDILAFAVWDPLGHSWDLAQGVGIEAHASDDVAQASIVVVGANAETLRDMGSMGDPVDVPADAPAMTRFLGLDGRDPNWR